MNEITIARKQCYGMPSPVWVARSANPAFNEMYLGRTEPEATEAVNQWNAWRIENGFPPVTISKE